MNQNSLTANAELQSSRPRRQKEILALFETGQIWTDRDVAELLSYQDLNAVRPRITELVQAGVLAVMGSTQCRVTGKTVRKLVLAKYAPKPVDDSTSAPESSTPAPLNDGYTYCGATTIG